MLISHGKRHIKKYLHFGSLGEYLVWKVMNKEWREM